MNYKTRLVKSVFPRHTGRPVSFETGWGNGYVIVPENHPLHGFDYNIANGYVKVHGGLTFSELCDDYYIKRFSLEEDDIGKWIFGFDTAHCGDDEVRWPEAAVQAETDYLLAQIVACSHLDKNKIK